MIDKKRLEELKELCAVWDETADRDNYVLTVTRKKMHELVATLEALLRVREAAEELAYDYTLNADRTALKKALQACEEVESE